MKLFVPNALLRNHPALQFVLILLLFCALTSPTRYRAYSIRRSRSHHKRYQTDLYRRTGIMRRIVRRLRSVVTTKDYLCNQTIQSAGSLSILLHNISRIHGHIHPFSFPRRRSLLDNEFKKRNTINDQRQMAYIMIEFLVDLKEFLRNFKRARLGRRRDKHIHSAYNRSVFLIKKLRNLLSINGDSSTENLAQRSLIGGRTNSTYSQTAKMMSLFKKSLIAMCVRS